uniref:Uncharacterized protein n=1 Tax=Panagrolaimus sp. JU765 TaxID=591449 RepID=A0AC34QL94_9BILA
MADDGQQTPEVSKQPLDFELADSFLDNYNGIQAYETLLGMRNESTQDDVGLNWRLAHACYILSNCSQAEEQRRAYLQEGHQYIVEAYKIAPEDPKVLHWAPIVTGSLAETAATTKDRIRIGHEFKKYIDEAIEKLPPEFAFFHMRGRFRYEVAALSTVERTLAALFFGSPPSATYEEALEDLVKAEDMDGGQIDNMLFLGKTYQALGNIGMARRFYTKVTKKAAVDAIDQTEIAEAAELLSKLPSPTPDEPIIDDSDSEEFSDSLHESDIDTAESFEPSSEKSNVD